MAGNPKNSNKTEHADAVWRAAASAFRDEGLDFVDLECAVADNDDVRAALHDYQLGVRAFDLGRVWRQLQLEPVYQRARRAQGNGNDDVRALHALLTRMRPTAFQLAAGRPKRRPVPTQARATVVRVVAREVQRELKRHWGVDVEAAQVNHLTRAAARALFPGVCADLTTKQVRDLLGHARHARKLRAKRA